MKERPVDAGNLSMLASGVYINVFSNEGWDYLSLKDIIIPLYSKIRYNGNFPLAPSVLRHSVDVAKKVIENFEDDVSSCGEPAEMWFRVILALFHDAHEALFFDIPSPMKCNQEVCGLLEKMHEFDKWLFRKILNDEYREAILEELQLQFIAIKKADKESLNEEWNEINNLLIDKDQSLLSFFSEKESVLYSKVKKEKEALDDFVFLLKEATLECNHLLSDWFINEVDNL